MKFGISLPHSGPLTNVAAIRQVAIKAERLGFESVWVHDHITYDLDWLDHRTSGVVEEEVNYQPDFYESLCTLAYVAGFTERVKLGTAIVVLPLRDPRVMARQALTIQSLSSGRLQLGLGLGDYPADFNVMGIPYDSKGQLTDEYLDVLRTIFPGGRSDYHGETIAFDSAAFFPVTEPIPMMLGGGIRKRHDRFELFEATLYRVARWCDGWLPEGPPELIASGIESIRQHAIEFGREDTAFQVRPISPMYLGDDKLAEAQLGRGHDFELAGSVATLRRKVADYQEAGANAINLRCWGENLDATLKMIKIFASEVMTHFSEDQ